MPSVHREIQLKYLAITTAVVGLLGCAATTGVIPTGSDTYMVSHRDNGPGSSLGALKAAAYRDATTFCAASKKSLRVLGSTDVPRSFGQFPETEVQFRCE
jgi:hypothetical protein